MYLLKITFSRITPANLKGFRQNFTGVCRPKSNLVLKFWSTGPKGRKMAAKMWIFC